MTEVEKLLALEDIKTLKARYFRCVDTKDWNGFAAVFAPDAAFDISEDVPDCILVGREKILGGRAAGLEGLRQRPSRSLPGDQHRLGDDRGGRLGHGGHAALER